MKNLTLILMSSLLVMAIHSEAKEAENAKVYSKADYVRLRKGANLNGGDQEKPYVEKLPEKFDGRKIYIRSTGSSEPLEFKVKKAGIVTLVTDFGARELIKQGWTKVGEISIVGQNGSGTLSILQNHLDIGEHSIPSMGYFGIRLMQ